MYVGELHVYSICNFSVSVECKFGAFGHIVLSGAVEASCEASSVASICIYRDHAKTLLNTQ